MNKKKILLISDDVRENSGISHMAREIIVHTSHKYDFVCVAAAMGHRQKGQKIDISEDVNKWGKIDNANVILYPYDSYGDPDLIRYLIKEEKPDALFIITDPRYYIWLFNIENEIRSQIPIIYLNIWDNVPTPNYNYPYYKSCDALFAISKLTKFVNEEVLGEEAKNKIIKYIPHGVSTDVFKPIPQDNKELIDFKNYLTQGKEYNFILLFNSRNIRRKQLPDTILAWKIFLDKLSSEEREKCLLILHTQPKDPNGTDILTIINEFFPDKNSQIRISIDRLTPQQMNLLYNSVDTTILISSNEGWGLALTESLLTGTPFIANVTGGMQDQMGFVDNKGKEYVNNIQVPSNHTKTYTNHGEWCLPVFPNNRSLMGSLPTPYIWDDRCDINEVADKIQEFYERSPKLRKKQGKEGFLWASSQQIGFTAKIMAERIIEGVEELFKTWKPREKYSLTSDKDFKEKVINHKINYE